MENESPIFSPENIIAILSIIIPVIVTIIGGVYTIITSTKKYELTENFREQLLQWYTEVVATMITIIHYCESGEFLQDSFESQRTELLSKLSFLTETGRFYFPNVIKNDGFGQTKPTAYQGYRHINLEFVLHFYFTASSPTITDEQIKWLWKFEKQFTSCIFDMIQPRKYNRLHSKYLSITIPPGETLEDFIRKHNSF